MTTATKTLEATLAPPTAHKERKLRDTLGTYREALNDAFDSGADTMGGVSDVVTPFDLPYQRRLLSVATSQSSARRTTPRS